MKEKRCKVIKNMKCPVCKNITFNTNNYEYEICKECFWEYDSTQVDNPNLRGGANYLSLNEYKKLYSSLLKCNPKFSCRNKEDADLITKLDHDLISEYKSDKLID